MLIFFFGGGWGMFSVRNDRILLGDCFCDFLFKKENIDKEGNVQFTIFITCLVVQR